MDQMTTKEKIAVEELSRRTINNVTPKMLEDVSLFYRFAKARDFNLGEAETMLRNHISTRKELEIDTLLTEFEPPEALVKYAPTSFICFNKVGCVVRHIDCGRTDANGIWSVATKTDLVKFCAQIIEKDIERVSKRGRDLGKPMYAAIADFENLTYANAMSVKNIQYLLYLLKLFADNYPETLKTLTIINAPSYFAWLYAALHPLFPSTITQKIRIYGKDDWKEVLLEENSSNDLPTYLGGKRTDPDGNSSCKTLKFGQPVPKRFYLENKTRKLSVEPDVEKLTVMPFSKEEITFEVTEKNSYLEWEFRTRRKDVDFSLLFKRETSEGFETEELIPKKRIDASSVPEKGCFKCEKVGNYTIVFDNSNSWLHLKEIYYRAGVTNAR